MKRQELEKQMKEKGIKQIDIIINESDPLAIYCSLVGGVLKDYTGHVVNRKIDIWGYLYWKEGKRARVPFERGENYEIHFCE